METLPQQQQQQQPHRSSIESLHWLCIEHIAGHLVADLRTDPFKESRGAELAANLGLVGSPAFSMISEIVYDGTVDEGSRHAKACAVKRDAERRVRWSENRDVDRDRAKKCEHLVLALAAIRSNQERRNTVETALPGFLRRNEPFPRLVGRLREEKYARSVMAETWEELLAIPAPRPTRCQVRPGPRKYVAALRQAMHDDQWFVGRECARREYGLVKSDLDVLSHLTYRRRRMYDVLEVARLSVAKHSARDEIGFWDGAITEKAALNVASAHLKFVKRIRTAVDLRAKRTQLLLAWFRERDGTQISLDEVLVSRSDAPDLVRAFVQTKRFKATDGGYRGFLDASFSSNNH
jgi:hypothetical protein